MGPRRLFSLAGFNPPPAAAGPPGDRNIEVNMLKRIISHPRDWHLMRSLVQQVASHCVVCGGQQPPTQALLTDHRVVS